MIVVLLLTASAQGALHVEDLARKYLLKDGFAYSPAAFTLAQSLIQAVWMFKPLVAALSDARPLCGRRRAPYVLIWALLAAGAYLSLGFAATRWQVFALPMLALAQLGMAACSTLVEGLIVAHGRRAGEEGRAAAAAAAAAADDDDDDDDVEEEEENEKEKGVNRGGDAGDNDDAARGSAGAAAAARYEAVKARMSNFITLWWLAKSVSKMSTAYAAGQMVEHWGVRSVFAATAVLPGLLVLAACFIVEPRVAAARRRQPWAATARPVVAALRRPVVWQPMVFLLLTSCMPTSSGAGFFFKTNALALSKPFMGTLKLVDSLGAACGLAAWTLLLKRFEYRHTIWAAVLGRVVVGYLALILIFRLNRRAGIGDGAFILPDAFVATFVGAIVTMPVVTLCAQTASLAPAIETTLYSVTLTMMDVGGLVSSALSAALTNGLGVTAHDSTNYWKLVVICNTAQLVPLACIGCVPLAAEFRRRQAGIRREEQAAQAEAAKAARDQQEADGRSYEPPALSPPTSVVGRDAHS